MLTEICEEIRNYFPANCGVYAGTFTISEGSIAPLDFLQDGQYFRIVGSVFNDGVHQYPTSYLTDETFNGEVWALAIPDSLISLSEEIEKYVEDANKNSSPYVSESWGGYSYTKATGDDGAPMSWKEAYSKQLNKWRKI